MTRRRRKRVKDVERGRFQRSRLLYRGYRGIAALGMADDDTDEESEDEIASIRDDDNDDDDDDDTARLVFLLVVIVLEKLCPIFSSSNRGGDSRIARSLDG